MDLQERVAKTFSKKKWPGIFDFRKGGEFLQSINTQKNLHEQEKPIQLFTPRKKSS